MKKLISILALAGLLVVNVPIQAEGCPYRMRRFTPLEVAGMTTLMMGIWGLAAGALGSHDTNRIEVSQKEKYGYWVLSVGASAALIAASYMVGTMPDNGIRGGIRCISEVLFPVVGGITAMGLGEFLGRLEVKSDMAPSTARQ